MAATARFECQCHIAGGPSGEVGEVRGWWSDLEDRSDRTMKLFWKSERDMQKSQRTFVCSKRDDQTIVYFRVRCTPAMKSRLGDGVAALNTQHIYVSIPLWTRCVPYRCRINGMFAISVPFM